MLYPFSESQSDLESETNFSSLQQKRSGVQKKLGKRNKNVSVSLSNVNGNGDNNGKSVINFRRRERGSENGSESESSRARSTRSTSSASSCSGGSSCSDGDSTTSSGEANLPYPGFAEISMKYLTQDSRPRSWCLKLITNPYQQNTWFERISIIVIIINCITLGMYQPCVDDDCVTNRCKILQMFDDIIFAFFSLELTIKMIAMGSYGKNAYLADSWNRLDFFIVFAGGLEYFLHLENLNLTAIRTIRVLRPLRAINRIPSMRILVMLLLDTLPMLGNVLLLCFFVFFIFGIVGVQLWEGILRQRCVLAIPEHVNHVPEALPEEFRVRVRVNSISHYYEFSKEQDWICSRKEDSGMHLCTGLPPYRIGKLECNESAEPFSENYPTETSCVDWNRYYTNCTRLGDNPFQGTISFDNIGLAWVAIFLVISLEGWTDIMYYVQDAHSFWDWIYFVLLIVIGSFFMINLCLVVIATQFAETKKREMERMRQERARFTSTSTLASSTNNSEPTTCYAEIVKYIGHLYRRFKRRLIKKLRLYKYQRQQRKEGLLPNTTETLTLSPNRIRHHHQKCPTFNRKTSNISEPLITVMVPLNSSSAMNHNTSIQTINESQISSPDNSEMSFENVRKNTLLKGANNNEDNKQKTILLKIPSMTESDLLNPSGSGFLSPPTSTRRRSSVMFNEYVILHTPPTIPEPTPDKNVCSSEKMTQTGDGIWQVNLPQSMGPHSISHAFTDCSELSLNDAMTCQELLAFSVAFSAALPTGQKTLESFYSTLARGDNTQQPNIDSLNAQNSSVQGQNIYEDFSCCYELHQASWSAVAASTKKPKKHSKTVLAIVTIYKVIAKILSYLRKYVQKIAEHKYFHQGILLAILINTLSMGIEFHDQPDYLTTTVELSNFVFSAIFAVEMILKIVAEGPFKYVANGFNVFDGVIVILSIVELCQEFLGGGASNSGLSVLRTFRLLRILKLVRFMPNLRRQLFVMLRTMDNVAVFFSLLILFIFIFSILGMYLFGGKFCKFMDDSGLERECECSEIVSKHPQCECDRKHFNNFLWATVTVFQILTQEDWNVVLFNGMEKTSHWAALYFVALMTFGNYVLFNLLVAILVEGFSSERNERREREQRELVKAKLREEQLSDTFNDYYDEANSYSDSTSTGDSYHEIKNKWHSAEELRKTKESNSRREPKCNIQKQRLLQPSHENTDDSMPDVQYATKRNSERDVAHTRDGHKILKKTHSTRDRKRTSIKKNKSLFRDPPIITTTAATPQDSPNCTLEQGATFKDWDILNFDNVDRISCQSIPTLLKPPQITSSFIALSDDRKYLDRAPPPTIQSEIKISPNLIKNSILSNSSSNEKSGSNKELSIPSKTDEPQENATTSVQRSSSFRKFSRSSSKRKKPKTKSESDANDVVLNNDRNHSQCNGNNNGNNSQQFKRNDSILSTTNRIQNDTKDTKNKFSPQNSVRRASTSGRRSSYMYNNSQLYQNLNRQNSMMNYQSPNISQRRMSSIEHVFEKSSNFNNLDNQNTTGLQNSKIDLDKTEKSLSNLNIPEIQTTQIVSESKIKRLIKRLEPTLFMEEREDYSMYIFPEDNSFRQGCSWFINQKWFDNVVLLFIALNCITLAMERPNIPPTSNERVFLGTANYIFTVVFAIEMFIKVIAAGMFYGPDAYFTSGWNIMDGSLVIISTVDLLMSLVSEGSPKIFGILRVFRLLRSLRPLRVINRAPGLKLVVQTLLSSLRPIGNIVLICCTFFIIFGILGVQLFKGTFYFCEGEHIKGVKNKTDCLAIKGNAWSNQKYNFDDLGKALMSLFVLSSRDGWVNIMYTGLDAVGVNQQPIVNYNEWRLLYFIAFILLVGFFVLNMFVGVVVENFHRCREEQEKEEKIRRAAKRALQMEKRRRRLHEPPYYTNYSPLRLFVHNVVTSKYFDLAIAAVIGLNVVTMAMEYYMMPLALKYALKIFNYFFTAVFILEAIMKLVALGVHIYMKDKWNQLDVFIVILSIVGIVLEELETNIIPINPTIIRVMRVLRIARVLKLLKMAKGIRALLDTVMQALPQVGNLGLLFFLLFFIFAALGVELFGRLECSIEKPCQGLGEHAHFENFGMAFLTLFRVATGDNWNGIMKDTLREKCDPEADCVKDCCVNTVIAPIFFVIFVLMAQFVLVNVVVAVLMKHLEESHKQMEEDQDMDTELERELEREQEFEEEQAMCLQMAEEIAVQKKPLSKVSSLPSNYTYNTPVFEKKYNAQRRQTIQYFNQTLGLSEFKTYSHNANVFNEQNSFSEAAEMSFNNENEPEFILTETVKSNIRKTQRRLGKQTSFDETKRNEYKKTSYDSLFWKNDKKKIILNKSTIEETDGSISSNTLKGNTSIIEEDTKALSDIEKNITKENVRPVFSKCYSLDATSSGKSYLSVPKLAPRSRSGSAKQLFKQKALEEDPDGDENSLLLPVICKQSSVDSETQEASTSCSIDDQNKLIPEKIEKSDSSELLRIISERRRIDKKDIEEDSDVNELLVSKSKDSSIDI